MAIDSIDSTKAHLSFELNDNHNGVASLQFNLYDQGGTEYSGVDPEVNTYGAGIQGAGSMGIDNLGTPNTRGFDVGLRFKF